MTLNDASFFGPRSLTLATTCWHEKEGVNMRLHLVQEGATWSVVAETAEGDIDVLYRDVTAKGGWPAYAERARLLLGQGTDEEFTREEHEASVYYRHLSPDE